MWLDASAGTPEDLEAAAMAVFRENRDAGDVVSAHMRDATRGETDVETSRVLKRYSVVRTVYDDPNGEASVKTRGVGTRSPSVSEANHGRGVTRTHARTHRISHHRRVYE